MIKSILLINGSPRAGNSNTLLLSNSFLEGFHQVNSEAHVETIILKECHIQPCRGCFSIPQTKKQAVSRPSAGTPRCRRQGIEKPRSHAVFQCCNNIGSSPGMSELRFFRKHG